MGRLHAIVTMHRPQVGEGQPALLLATLVDAGRPGAYLDLLKRSVGRLTEHGHAGCTVRELALTSRGCYGSLRTCPTNGHPGDNSYIGSASRPVLRLPRLPVAVSRRRNVN